MKLKAGIVGVAGYGGGELVRLLAGHPHMELAYAAGESTAGTMLSDRFPAVRGTRLDLKITKFDPTALPPLDVLFASLPTGASQAPLAQVPAGLTVVDIGGDHRYQPGWVYGLADVVGPTLAGVKRIANPGCFPAASLIALAPLLKAGLIDPNNIIIDAKTGVSGAGRGGGDSKFTYAEVNEDLAAYGLLKHTHMPEIAATIDVLGGVRSTGLVFTPHLCPMTRGILATIYCRGTATTEAATEAAEAFYAGRGFVKVCAAPPHTKWATGTNFAFVHYACDPARNLVMAISTIDNLGKGAAGQALQNANLALGLEETAGLMGLTVWP